MRLIAAVYEECKYTSKEEPKKIVLEDVRAYYVLNRNCNFDSIREIEEDYAETDKDEYHEYLILIFKDNTSSIYRNSHIDIFKY